MSANRERPAVSETIDDDVRSAAAGAPLIDHQDQLRALLENVPALVFTMTLDARIVFVNRAPFDIPMERMVGRNLFDFPGQDTYRQLAREAFARAVATGTGVDYEVPMEWPPGVEHWFACRLGPVVRDGRVVAMVLICTDITERKAVEHTLLESESRFRRIAEQSPDIIFRLGVQGLEYISPAFATVLGTSPTERLASTALAPHHVHPDELERLPALIEQLDRGPVRYELRLVHADGHTVWTEHHLVPILSASGKRIAVEGIVRDISERKRAEAALQRAHRELEDRVVQRTAELAAANESLRTEIAERVRAQDQLRQHQAALAHVLRVSTMGEMAAGLAHEINQPLGAIANFANGIKTRLRAGTIEPHALLNAAERIAAEALRAGEVIRRLRDFLRRDDSKREPADLNELVREAAHLVEPDARCASIVLRLALDPDLPRPEIDPIQIEQVLLNLMRNGLEAMAAMENGAHELLVETAQLTGDSIEVRVRDTGPGVAPTVRDRVFDAFFTTKSSGLGMGLSISRSLIEDHGGSLWMRPNRDRGTTFGFSLPLSCEPLSAERRAR